MLKLGYSRKAVDLYVNNVNVGALRNANIASTFLGPCGDLIKLYLKISKEKVITDAKFYYLGCPASALSASAMTQILKGKTVDQAKKITEEEVSRELEGLPKSKNDCIKLSIETLQKAIFEYEKKEK